MAYPDRDWDNTGPEVTKEDFKRIEKGIKNNDNQINVLNDDRGYLNTKSLSPLSYVSEIPKKNGKYKFISNANAVEFPLNFAWLYCDVTTLDDSNVEYKLRTIVEPVSREWRGNLTNGVWRGWKEIVTINSTVNKTTVDYSVEKGSSIMIPFSLGSWYLSTRMMGIGGSEMLSVHHVHWINQHAKSCTEISRLNFGNGSLITFEITSTGVKITNGLSAGITLRVAKGVLS